MKTRSNFQVADIRREMQQAEWHHPCPLVDVAVGHQDPLHPQVLGMLADDGSSDRSPAAKGDCLPQVTALCGDGCIRRFIDMSNSSLIWGPHWRTTSLYISPAGASPATV